MATTDDDPDREHERQAAEAAEPTAESSTRLEQAAEGIMDAQAWKGQQIANAWRKLMNALHRHSPAS